MNNKRKEENYGYFNYFGGMMTVGFIIASANDIHKGNFLIVLLAMMPVIISGIASVLLTLKDQSHNKRLVRYALPKVLYDPHPVNCFYSSHISTSGESGNLEDKA